MATSFVPNIAPYYALPLWRDYLVAVGHWEQAHAAYCSVGLASESVARDRRLELETAMAIKDEMLACLRTTPEHLAAFGW